MAVRKMLFGSLRCDDRRRRGLTGHAGGEPVDVARHAPAFEPKGATYTALRVAAGRATASGRRLRRRRVKETAWIPRCFTRVDETTGRSSRSGAMRVPGDHLCRRSSHSRYGRQGLRTGAQRRHAAGHRRRRPTRCPTRIGAMGFRSAVSRLSMPIEGGVVSAGGVGFDISCGVRTMLTGLKVADICPCKDRSPTRCFVTSRQASAAPARSPSIPSRWTPCSPAARAGRSSAAGARRAISIASRSAATMAGAKPERSRTTRRNASARDGHARLRQSLSRGSGGRGDLRRRGRRKSSALPQDDVVVTIHCGSRGLGHQIGTEFLKEMVIAAAERRHRAPRSRTRLRADQFGNRAALSRRDARSDQLRARQPRDSRPLTRGGSSRISSLLPDVGPALRRFAQHLQGRDAHGRGQAPRAFRPSQGRDARLRARPPKPAAALRAVGQPVLIGGSMGTGSYILVGAAAASEKAFSLRLPWRGARDVAPCRTQAMERARDRRRFGGAGYSDPQPVDARRRRGGAGRLQGCRRGRRCGRACGLARRVARLRPLICIKG